MPSVRQRTEGPGEHVKDLVSLKPEGFQRVKETNMSRTKQMSPTKHYGLNATLIGMALVTLTACGEIATLPVAAGTGPNPTLPPPQHALIPTVNIAPAIGWPSGATPQGA